MNVFPKGTGISMALFPLGSSASCSQRVNFNMSAAFVSSRFYHNFIKHKTVNSVYASNVDDAIKWK